MSSSTRTLDQERARHALKRIQSLEEKGAAYYGNYRSYVDGLPANIVNSGIGQACATLLSQARGEPADPHRLLYNHVHEWLCRDDDAAPYRKKPDLIAAIIEGSQRDYVRAQAESIEYLSWLKKFARAYLDKKQGND